MTIQRLLIALWDKDECIFKNVIVNHSYRKLIYSIKKTHSLNWKTGFWKVPSLISKCLVSYKSLFDASVVYKTLTPIRYSSKQLGATVFLTLTVHLKFNENFPLRNSLRKLTTKFVAHTLMGSFIFSVSASSKGLRSNPSC